MLPSLLLNALGFSFLASPFVVSVSADGRSGYDQVDQTDNAGGRSGYNQVKQPDGADGGRSGYNKIKRSRRGASPGAALYAIPTDWSSHGSGVFVMDPDLSCDQDNLVASKYLDTDTANATGTCYNGKLYHLLYARSASVERFSIPPGLTSVNLSELVAGSVQTYQSNGKRNHVATARVPRSATINDQDVITPDSVQIPVCGPDEALKNWKNAAFRHTRYPTFPCNEVDQLC